MESFSSSLVCRRTFAGGAGAEASDARVAAFNRATFGDIVEIYELQQIAVFDAILSANVLVLVVDSLRDIR